MENEDKNILLLDEELSDVIMEEKCAALKPIVTEFVESYVQNQDKTVEEWLGSKMQESLPEKTPEEIQSIADDIITTLKTTEDKQKSLEEAVKNGRSKESWFESEIQTAVSGMSMQETVEYLSNLDGALNNTNEAMNRTITTKAGVISQNRNLDGFIAEQYHAQTFNMNAEATGSQYRAKVLEPDGKRYAKNSVDIVIVNDKGKIVRKYQSKYCQNAKATQRNYEQQGDYSFQRMLIPDGQQDGISRKCTTVLEAPDGTTSNALSKEDAKQMQIDAQNGKWEEANWNEYHTKDVAVGIAKSVRTATAQGMIYGAGFNIAQKLFTGENIDGGEVVETALISGADSGVKAAAAGAIKVGAEKGILPAILKETTVASNIAYIGIENVKVIGKMASGELTGKECAEKMEQTTVAAVAGIKSSVKGAAIGASIGAVLGPIGSTVGKYVGGAISYIAGSKIGETVVKGAQKIGHAMWEGVKAVGRGIADLASAAWSGVKSLFSLW